MKVIIKEEMEWGHDNATSAFIEKRKQIVNDSS